MSVGDALLAVTSRQIVRSDGSGQSTGTLFFGRYLDQAYFDEIGLLSQVRLILVTAERAMIDPRYLPAIRMLELGSEYAFSVDQQHEASVVKSVDDIFGKPVFLLEARYPANMIIRGERNNLIFGVAGVILSFAFVLLIFFIEERLVLRKLYRLKSEVNRIAASQKAKERIAVHGSDEFAALGADINSMLVSLEEMIERTEQSESRFSVVAHLAPVMIWMTDATGRVIYLNKSAEDTVTHTAGQKTWEESIYLEDRGVRSTLIAEAQEAKKPFRLEYRLGKLDGGYVWVSESAIPHNTSAGKFVGYVGVVVNIHKEKEIQLQTKEFTKEVEQMNDLLMAREDKMIEMKAEIHRLKEACEKHDA